MHTNRFTTDNEEVEHEIMKVLRNAVDRDGGRKRRQDWKAAKEAARVLGEIDAENQNP